MTQSTIEKERNTATPEGYVETGSQCADCNGSQESKSYKLRDRLHYFGHLAGGLKSVAVSRFLSKRPRPFSLSHMVTNKCNSDCPYCFWKNFGDQDDLTTAQIKKMYAEAKKEGFMTSILWGGEPLLREDFAEICKASLDNGMYTKVATNGYYITENPDYLKYADLSFVSIDAIGEEHDIIRKTPGLFDRAVEGMRYIRSKHPKKRVYICHCVSSESDGKIKEVAELAKDLDVLLYFVVNKSNQDFKDWEGKDGPKKHEKEMGKLADDFKYIKDLKNQGYPIRNSDYFMDYIIDKKNYYQCHWPKVTLVVYSNGEILRCSDRKPIADLKEMTLGEAIRSSEYRHVAENSQNCKLACLGNYSLDSSGLWNFEYKAIKSIAEFAIT